MFLNEKSEDVFLANSAEYVISYDIYIYKIEFTKHVNFKILN